MPLNSSERIKPDCTFPPGCERPCMTHPAMWREILMWNIGGLGGEKDPGVATHLLMRKWKTNYKSRQTN